MRSRSLLVAAVSAVFASQAGASILYDPVVTTLGDGTTALSSAGFTTTMRVYQNTAANQASPVAALAYNSGATGTRLVTSGSATSEGNLANNPALADAAAAGQSYSGAGYVFSAGYDSADLTTSISSSGTNANRVIGYMSVGNDSVSSPNIPLSQTQATAHANNNIRSAVGDDSVTNFWSSGAGSGTTGGARYFNTNTQLTSLTNTRATEIRNGQLFASTGSGTTGLYSLGTGTPTSSGNTATLMIGTTSPYEFALFDDPSNSASTIFGIDTAYIADDDTTANGGGIQKWVWNGSTWSKAYTLNDGTGGNRGLAGQLDPDTGKVVLWATTAAADKLEQITDAGAGSSFITLATAPTNLVFRGVALTTTTVPEPTSIAIFGLASLLAARRRR